MRFPYTHQNKCSRRAIGVTAFGFADRIRAGAAPGIRVEFNGVQAMAGKARAFEKRGLDTHPRVVFHTLV